MDRCIRGMLYVTNNGNLRKALSTLETIVADFGDNLSPNSATVDGFGVRRQSPFLATVAEFGDSRRFWRQSPNLATIVASVDRL